jgi:tetratricopeptide (TPR) repeat protein
MTNPGRLPGLSLLANFIVTQISCPFIRINYLANILIKNSDIDNPIMTERQIEKIKKKIKFYRTRLAAEKRLHGDYDDSAGLRYIIPELYFKIRDYKGALVYFRWFLKAFPDDTGFPFFNLLWSVAFFENNKIPEAIQKAYETAFSNTYLLELIAGRDTVQLDKSETIGYENFEYAKQIYKDCINLITLDFQIWISKLSGFDDFKANLNKFISIQKLIKDEPVGPIRTSLIQESYKFESQLTGRISNVL